MYFLSCENAVSEKREWSESRIQFVCEPDPYRDHVTVAPFKKRTQHRSIVAYSVIGQL